MTIRVFNTREYLQNCWEELTKIHRKMSDAIESEECCICLGGIEESLRASLSCGHSQFHKKCITDWAAISMACPMCKGEFSCITSNGETVPLSKKEINTMHLDESDDDDDSDDEEDSDEDRMDYCAICEDEIFTFDGSCVYCECGNGVHKFCVGIRPGGGRNAIKLTDSERRTEVISLLSDDEEEKEAVADTWTCAHCIAVSGLRQSVADFNERYHIQDAAAARSSSSSSSSSNTSSSSSSSSSSAPRRGSRVRQPRVLQGRAAVIASLLARSFPNMSRAVASMSGTRRARRARPQTSSVASSSSASLSSSASYPTLRSSVAAATTRQAARRESDPSSVSIRPGPSISSNNHIAQLIQRAQRAETMSRGSRPSVSSIPPRPQSNFLSATLPAPVNDRSACPTAAPHPAILLPSTRSSVSADLTRRQEGMTNVFNSSHFHVQGAVSGTVRNKQFKSSLLNSVNEEKTHGTILAAPSSSSSSASSSSSSSSSQSSSSGSSSISNSRVDSHPSSHHTRSHSKNAPHPSLTSTRGQSTSSTPHIAPSISAHNRPTVPPHSESVNTNVRAIRKRPISEV